MQFINSAVAATTSSYASQCVDDFVPSDTDIVFLEYALNDWEVVDSAKVAWMDNYQRWENALSLFENPWILSIRFVS
jgi:hypothetical protein